MFDLTTLDYIYVGVLLASTIWATIRGGVYETVATLSWVVAAITARFVSPRLDGLLQSWFDLSDSTVGTLIASYFIVFFVILLLFGFFNQKLRDKIHDSMMKVTDRTLGVIFGIIRGIVVMGIVYWVALWYYSDAPFVPSWLDNCRTRPVMQYTAEKLDEWFVPGETNKLLARDRVGTIENAKLLKNLIDPAVSSDEKTQDSDADSETGYKASERNALDNQVLQLVATSDAEAEENGDSPDVPTEE